MSVKLWALPPNANEIALLNANGRLYRTQNFQAGSPTWSVFALTLSTPDGLDASRIDGFVVDPLSPGFTGEGPINGWFTTCGTQVWETTYSAGTGVVCIKTVGDTDEDEEKPGYLYRIEDIFGTPIVTCKKRFAYAALSTSARIEHLPGAIGRNLQVSLTDGRVICLTHYQLRGTFWTRWDAANEEWVETSINSNTEDGPNWDHEPGLWLATDPNSSVKARCAVFSSSGSGQSAQGDLYELTDWNGSWALANDPLVNFGNSLGGDLGVPYHDNADAAIMYYGYRYLYANGYGQDNYLYRSNGNTQPELLTTEFGRPRPGGISIALTNQQRLVVGSVNQNSLYSSIDGGENWDQIVGSLDNIYPAIASDGKALYSWGRAAAVGFSSDFEASGIVTRATNPPFVPSALDIEDDRFIGLASRNMVRVDEPLHDGEYFCPYNNASGDGQTTNNPISLRKGEKRFEATDLTLNTPAGALAFKRKYRQSKQTDTNFQFMGLGWTHNHRTKLTLTDTAPNRRADVLLPNGGILKLKEDSANQGHFEAFAGSNSVLDYANNQYTLTAPDGSTYVFGHELTDASGALFRLETQAWAHGERWTYQYASDVTGTPASHQLIAVDDGYGRGLQFSYVDNSAQFDDGQLWRVGDQDATGLASTTPSGRYIEFTYTPEKSNGQVVTGAQALLASVQDVRGEVWTYDYYGQAVGETDADMLNFLIARYSPAVDTDGDGTPEAAITLESVDYTVTDGKISQVTQDRGDGLLTTTLTFDVLGSNGEQTTTEQVAGQTTTHFFDSGVYAGAENPAGNRVKQVPDSNYRASSQQDASGNTTQLDWSGDGRQLEQVTDALGHETAFAYDDHHRLIMSTDAENRKTNYIYAAQHRQPTAIIVGPQTTEIDLNGDMELDSGWTAISAATHQRRQTQVESGSHARYVEAGSTGQGIVSATWDLKSGQTYALRARVFAVSGEATLRLVDNTGQEIANTAVVSQSTGQWETLARLYVAPTDYAEASLQCLASNGAATFYVDTVSVTVSGAVDVNGDMETPDPNSGWTNVGAGTASSQSTAQVESGTYARYVDAAAADEGIESGTWMAWANQTYTVRAQVYVVSGTVKLQVADNSGQPITTTVVPTQTIGGWEAVSCHYTPGSDASGLKLQFLAASAGAEFYVDTVSITLRQEPDLNGAMEADTGWASLPGTVTNERCVRVESGDYCRYVAASAADGIKSTTVSLVADHTYVLMARVYPVNDQDLAVKATKLDGVSVVFETQRSFSSAAQAAYKVGQWHTLRAICQVTANADVTIQLVAETAPAPDDAEFYVDTMHLVDLGVLEGEIESQVRWQEFAYDRHGRTLVESTISPLDASLVQETRRSYYATGWGSGLLEQVAQVDTTLLVTDATTTYTYDSVGRVVKTHKTSMSGSCQTSYTVYDNTGQVLATACGSFSTSVVPVTVAELFTLYDATHAQKKYTRLTVYAYDSVGRRTAVTTQAGISLAQTNLTFYDSLNRVWRTLGNYQAQGSTAPGDWVWNASATPPRWEDGTGTALDFGTDKDANHIADTAYNARGMVRLRRDVLGNVTLYGYDTAGRLVRTVQNALTPDHNNDYIGTTPDPALSAYSASTTTPDGDLVTEQAYAANGNLVQSIDVRGQNTFMVYDALNRVVKTVRSARSEATLALNPGDTGYDETNDPRSDNYVLSTAPDRDLVEVTEYDALGRVAQTKRLLEARGGAQWDATYFVYDQLDRQVRTIAQYVPHEDPATDPSDWVWMTDHWEDGAGHPIDHGNNDQNVITETVYNAAGQVQATLDVNRTQTLYVYNGLGQQVKTITNYVPQGSSEPADWAWSDTNGQWEYGLDNGVDHGVNNDQNLVTEPVYDADGRVWWSRDAEGKRVWNVYDTQGRLVTKIVNYAEQGTSSPVDWVWSEANARWEDGTGNPIQRYSDLANPDNFDQNVITTTVYDAQGRIQKTRDVHGNLTLIGYNDAGQRVKTVHNALDTDYDVDSDPDLSEYVRAVSAEDDEDYIIETTEARDPAGRVTSTVDRLGIETRHVYDALGRRLRTVNNYVAQGSAAPTDWVWSEANTRWEDGSGAAIGHGTDNDQNLISDTTYNKAGQVLSTRDVRGTQTAFVYDAAGRRVQVVQAASSPLETTAYTCYDKAGRVLRTIQNWVDDGVSPDEQDTAGAWVFAPPANDGGYNDRNRVTTYEYDIVGRRVRVSDPVGNETHTTYRLDGQVYNVSDPGNVVTLYRYDALNRKRLVVHNHLAPPQIVFMEGEDVNHQIAVTDKDGLNRMALTNNDFNNIDPVWSPDGKKILFGVYNPNDPSGLDAQIYVMDADGSNQTQLTTGGTNGAARWSPDGTKIVFVRASSLYSWDIWVMDADGANPTQLTPVNGAIEWVAVWSPDGTQIAFESDRDGITGIYVMDADGSNQTRLTNVSVYAHYPVWSPEGSKIAYLEFTGTHVMDADGSNSVQLTASRDVALSWSPDGSKIAFFSQRDIQSGLYVMDADGSNQTKLSPLMYYGGASFYSPLWWSLDGQQIYFWSGGSLYRIDMDGNNQTLLVVDCIQPGLSYKVSDPATWQWEELENRWEDNYGKPVFHGANNDQNVIVEVGYDIAGRKLSQRDPRGHLTAYAYDQLGRRIKLTNPLNKAWETTYTDQNGAARTVLADPKSVNTQRDFDRLGRLVGIGYGDAAITPDVTFSYDAAGNRSVMAENDGSANVRVTHYGYDDLRRLTQVGFDIDGDDAVDESVSYVYDVGGRRTQLTLPGSLDVTYDYDAKGRLIRLTDWDGHATSYAYDNASRLIAAERHNGLRSRYAFDAAGRLRSLRHSRGAHALAHFAYEVDGRGNRTQALELLAHPATTGDTIYAYDDKNVVYRGTWTDADPFMRTTQFGATLQLLFFGEDVTLTYGTGPNHSLFDVYINGGLWRSFDGYAATSGEEGISLALESDGPHLLEIRNRAEHSLAAQADASYDASQYVLRFKSLLVADVSYDLRTIQYRYDGLARLLEARYNPGSVINTPDADLLRRYQYSYDLAGNRLVETVTVDGGPPVTTSFSYNEANQITNAGFAYDNNGNLTNDRANTYTWDRANRLVSMGGVSYTYDGAGNRIEQTNGVDITRYLLDLQPGLVKVLAQTTNSSTTRFVHGPHGIHAQEDNAGDWTWTVQDGLGSVRSVVDDDPLAVDSFQSYAPYGEPVEPGTFGSPFKFTGEMVDANDLVYLRARYYAPALGVFTGLDPVEGSVGQAMSLNRYGYVGGNVINMIDPSGMFGWGTFETEPGDSAYCIGREGGIPNALLQAFTENLRQLNPGAFMPDSRNWLWPGMTLIVPDTFGGISNIHDTGLWKRNGCHCSRSIEWGRCNTNNNSANIPEVSTCGCPEGQSWDPIFQQCLVPCPFPLGRLKPNGPCGGTWPQNYIWEPSEPPMPPAGGVGESSPGSRDCNPLRSLDPQIYGIVTDMSFYDGAGVGFSAYAMTDGNDIAIYLGGEAGGGWSADLIPLLEVILSPVIEGLILGNEPWNIYSEADLDSFAGTLSESIRLENEAFGARVTYGRDRARYTNENCIFTDVKGWDVALSLTVSMSTTLEVFRVHLPHRPHRSNSAGFG